MTKQEKKRLQGYWLAKRSAPRWTGTSRRTAKSIGRAVGQLGIKGVYPLVIPSSKI